MTPSELSKLKSLAEALNGEGWDYYLETGMEGHGALITYDEDKNGMRSYKESVFKKLYDDRPNFEIKKMFLAEANPQVILSIIGQLEASLEVIRFYANHYDNWFCDGNIYCEIGHDDCSIVPENLATSKPIGGKRARQFLSTLETKEGG